MGLHLLALAALALGPVRAQEPSSSAPRAVIRAESPPPVESAPAASERRWALLIGVNDYRDGGPPDLRFAENDVRAIAKRLVDSGSYEPARVIVMTTDAGDEALRPTRGNIIDLLTSFTNKPASDSVLFYFSGHGISAEEYGVRQSFLLPSDARLSDPAASGLSLKFVLDKLQTMPTRQRLLVLDACREQPILSDSRALGDAWSNRTPELATGTQILFATKVGERSYEDPERQLGVFTAHLVDGLAGPADEHHGAPDGRFTVRETFDYVSDNLAKDARPGRQQVPTLSGESTGDLFIMARKGWSPPPPPPPDHLQAGRVVFDLSEAQDFHLIDATGETRSKDDLPPGQYTIRATFPGFHEGPVGELTVPAGQTVHLRCEARFVTCYTAGVTPGVGR